MNAVLVAFALLGEMELQAGSPFIVLWSGPGILVASLMIAWGAEASQFFLAQGIALAVLALLQTLPEFAVEAVLAWRQQVPYLFANLTGALMLLTGLGWPMIYLSAATAYRRRHRRPMRNVPLAEEQAVQIVALLAGIAYEAIIWWKGSLTLADSVVLIAIYAAYLWVMHGLPPKKAETVDEIARIPRAIVVAPKHLRIGAILFLFLVGGAAVFLIADPFLRGLFGLSTLLGVSKFRFIQWVAPVVSEAPEAVSAFYWARDSERAAIALMNLVSSNINQWTLLAALLPVVLSASAGHPAAIPLDATQSRDLLLTLSQSLLGALFLMKMELTWWEAAGLFVLFLVSLIFSRLHVPVTVVQFAWCAIEAMRLSTGRGALALGHFRRVLLARLETKG